MKSLLLLALGLARTVVLGARPGRAHRRERPALQARAAPLPVCGRACDFYDMANRGAPGLWRAMDLARSACYLEYAPCRVRCQEHGVRTEAVPWARHGARLPRASFEDWVAWLAVRCTACGGLRARPRRVAQRGRRAAGASTPSWRPRAAPQGSTACAASASTRRRTRRATSTSRWSSTTTSELPHLGARGHRQGRAQPVPRRAHARAEARHRGGDRRRREVDKAAGQAPLPQREDGHRTPSTWSSG